MYRSYENLGEYGMKIEAKLFSCKAPEGMFRVVGEDIRSNNFWQNGDFYEKDEAIRHANEKHGDFVRMHVYDDTGQKIDESHHLKARFIN